MRDRETARGAVLHVAYSEGGGIGEVVSLVSLGLQGLGWTSEVRTLTDGALVGQVHRHPVETARAVLDEYVVRASGFNGPISKIRSLLPRLSVTDLERYDVVHIHTGFQDFAKRFAGSLRGKVIVVTAHDLRNFSLACHQSLGCRDMRNGCLTCPALRRARNPRCLSEALLDNLHKLASNNRVEVTAPTEWMKSRVELSKFFRALGATCHIVPNPVNTSGIRPNRWGKRILIVGSTSKSRLRQLSKDELLRLKALASDLGVPLEMAGLVEIEGRVEKNYGVVSRNVLQMLIAESRGIVVPASEESFSLTAGFSVCVGVPVISRPGTASSEIGKSAALWCNLNDLSYLPEKSALARSAEEMSVEKISSKFAVLYGGQNY